MQSGQDCLIYHMLGNSLRRLHVSRTKIGSLLTGWFAERLWAKLAFKPFSSPEHPPNTSFLWCALLFPSSIQVTTKIFNRWKVKAKWVQSADCHDIDNNNRGSRKISCKNMVWEDFAICQGWVGEKLFRALRDAQLCCMPKFVIDFWFCRNRKPRAMWAKGLWREHKEKRNLGQSLRKVWKCHDPNLDSALLKDPSSLPPGKIQRICSAETVFDTPPGHNNGFTPTSLSVFCDHGTS